MNRSIARNAESVGCFSTTSLCGYSSCLGGALFDYDNNTLISYREEKFLTKDCKNFALAIKNFLKANEQPEIICLGVAGPVMGGKVHITNISLKLDNHQLSIALDGIPVYFINDLEAATYGISQLKANGFNTIHRGKGNSTGNIALTKQPKLPALEGFFRHFAVLHAQGQDGFALGMRNKGIKIIDVDFCFQQRGHQLVQFRG